jgi:hypothetical protein
MAKMRIAKKRKRDMLIKRPQEMRLLMFFYIGRWQGGKYLGAFAR